MPHISAKRLSKSFKDGEKITHAYESLNLDIPRGQFCALIGPSGCGKSSFLRTVAGLENPTQGQLQIHVQENDHRTGFIFQEADLFPWMSLQRNIEFFLQNNPRIDKDKISEIASNALASVGLSKFSNYLPGKVSGGMQQRVSIARCFANEADLLLMDEPFVYLDYQTRLKLHQILLDIWRGSGKTVVFVTHDIDEAVFLADRVLVMSAHPGTIVKDIELSFKRPRDYRDLRKNKEYIDLVDELSQLILSAA